MNCKHSLGYGATSPEHARTMDISNHCLSLAWCVQCSQVTVYRKPYFRRLFGLSGLRPEKSLPLNTIAKEFWRYSNGQPHYQELIWLISRCLVERAQREGAEDVERAAWKMAQEKLLPFHQLVYLQEIQSKIPNDHFLAWINEVESHIQQEPYNPVLEEFLLSVRSQAQGQKENVFTKIDELKNQRGKGDESGILQDPEDDAVGFMMLKTTAMMLVAKLRDGSDGRMAPTQFDRLVKCVSLYANGQKTEEAITQSLKEQFIIVSRLDEASQRGFFENGKTFSLEGKQEIIIDCFSIAMLGNGPNDRQTKFAHDMCRWVDGPIAEMPMLLEMAKKAFAKP